MPKKRSRDTDVCVTDDFRGISLTSVAYKAMCAIVQVRLEQVVEGGQLLAEEQGGFHKGRGCRDQIVILILLGQIKMMTKKRGLFTAFIDFKKAYDRVDRSKFWRCLENKGINGRLTDFLKAVYTKLSCEVKVGEEFSEQFGVTNGLRQGCVLSPLLFALYINSLINELKIAGVGIECRGQRVAALLYADDMVLFAEDEKMRLGLRILREWCVQWAVKVNAEMCGIMHLRKNGVKRTEEKFEMNGERIEVIEEYKYLVCTINQHMECKGMVKERANAGARALSSCLRGCTAAIGEVKGETFMKLMESLVKSVLLYGAEVWGCGRQLEQVEQVQLRAARIFLGVRRLHPKVALLFEMKMLPLKWEARSRCIDVWLKVLRMGDNRLIRSVMLEAMEMRGKVKWLLDLEQSLGELVWKGVSVEDMRRLSSGEIRQMLRDSAWRMVREAWDAEIQERSKLGVVKGLLECGCQSRLVDVGSKRIRRMLAKLRGGTAELRVETGRWNGLKKEERICKQCTMGEVENEEHFLLRCEGYAEERL